MTAADGVVLPAGRHMTERAVSIQLEAIGRHLALRDRRPETQRGVHEHSAIGGAAQSAACGASPDERLHENGHGRVRRIQVVRRHVAQRARRPERRPARAHGGQHLGLVVDAQVALELPREARSEAILHERRRPHDDERARAIDEIAPGLEQRLQHGRVDRLLEQSELHLQRVLPRLRRMAAGKGSARGCLQAQRSDLVPVRVGGETKAVGDRQARAPEAHKVGRLRTNAARVGGRGRGQRDDHGWNLTVRALRTQASDRPP